VDAATLTLSKMISRTWPSGGPPARCEPSRPVGAFAAVRKFGTQSGGHRWLVEPAGMTDTPSSCVARVVLTDDQVAWLDARPHGAHEVRAQPCCALENGHRGPHAAMGQQANRVEWWIRWTLQASEIVETHICPVENDTIVNAHGEHDPCLLFNGHPGRHSFELD
jgi:hypothetical protein